ncbi:hypothetical protein D3C78_1604880 [compost metagenome]
MFGIGAEGAGGRVGDHHLAQAAHQQDGDQGADGVAEDHARSGQLDRRAAAQEQAGADRAADGDHGQLRAGQALQQVALPRHDRVEAL